MTKLSIKPIIIAPKYNGLYLMAMTPEVLVNYVSFYFLFMVQMNKKKYKNFKNGKTI